MQDLFIYLFRSTTQWCRVHTQSTLICEAEKKKEKEILYSSAKKSHIYTHSSSCKTGNNKEAEWTKSEFKSVNKKLAHRKCIVPMNAFEIKILTSISHASRISLNVF